MERGVLLLQDGQLAGLILKLLDSGFRAQQADAR